MKHNKKLFLICSLSFLLCSFMIPAYIQAEEDTPWGADTIPVDVRPAGNEIGFRGESTWDFIENIVTRLANYLLFLGLIVVPLVVLVGVFMIFLAGGDPSKVTVAKKLIFWSVAILGVILISRVAVSALRSIISFN